MPQSLADLRDRIPYPTTPAKSINNATAQLGGISVSLRHFPRNSWCAHRTITDKTWSASVHVASYLISVIAAFD